MDASSIISLLGGVALFLFGMSVMGDSLKKVAGNKMEMVLYKLAGNPVKGIMLGAGVTAVIQSSSATSVMVVGFVNSGDDEVWTEGTKEMPDDMHKRKIDMADEIFVINVGGYIGSSTRSEIEYATATGKTVRYLEPPEE